MRRIWLPALVSVLLVGTMAVPALAGKADKARPFQAKTDVVSEVPSTDCDPGYELGFDTKHIGTGTHLGRFHLSETLCLDFDSNPVKFQVTGTLVAANGDKLYFDAANGTGWIFDGGTGRFENASGQADETLIRNSDGDLIALTVKGTITYNASDRSN